jgi:hypothetical protein
MARQQSLSAPYVGSMALLPGDVVNSHQSAAEKMQSLQQQARPHMHLGFICHDSEHKRRKVAAHALNNSAGHTDDAQNLKNGLDLPPSNAKGSDIRARLVALEQESLTKAHKDGSSHAAFTARALLNFHDLVVNEHKSVHQAARKVVETMHVRNAKQRKNAATSADTKKRWYRYRARALVTKYKHFQETGQLLPETRGRKPPSGSKGEV